MLLINVVSGPVLEDNMQGHAEVVIVHRSGQVRHQCANREIDRTVVSGEIFLCRLDQSLTGFGRVVVHIEEDNVSKLAVR